MKKNLMIIDGSSLLYRAFYAMPPLSDSQGRPTNAVYGFLNMLLKLYADLDPYYVAVAFDKDKHTFRNELYADYKATRKPAPDELRPQFALIREVLACLGIHVLETEGYEGDDIIGTVAKQVPTDDTSVSVITGDRDALQLVDDNITVYLTKKGISEMLAVTPDVMQEEYGYTPAQVIDMKALMGDTSDNIPGVPGVGEKTALKLITEYGTVEGVYEHLDDISGKKLREKLADNKDKAMLSKELATINCHVPVEFDEAGFLPHPREGEVRDLFKQLGFRNLLKRFAAFDRFAFLEQAEETVTLKQLKELKARDVKGQTVALAALYENTPGHSKISTLTLAVEGGVYEVKSEDIGQWLTALEDSEVVVTADGKSLYKAALCAGIGALPAYDVTLAAYLLDPTRTTYGLTYLSEVFGRPLNEVKGEAQNETANEAAFVYSLYGPVQQALEEKGLSSLFETIESPLERTLAVMELNGFTVNRDRLEEMKADLSREADALETEIYDLAGESFNINSTKQLGVILFEKMGIPGGKKTKTGYSTAVDVLEKLSEDYPIVAKVMEYRTYAKLNSTYAEGLLNYIGEDSRIHGVFQQTVTATGRLSSTDPNLQNIPIRTEMGRHFRSVFIPKEGCIFLDADYSQIELRILAALSKDERLIEAYRMDRDIHKVTASQVFHVPLDEVTDELRRNAKAVNFGIVYGISAFGLSEGLSIGRADAKEYIERYFTTYPKVKEYLDSEIAFARENGYVKTVFGRRRPIPEIHASNFMRRSFSERVAMNSPIQGTAADMMKVAMNAVYEELKRKELKSEIVLQVHDELLLEVPEEELDEVREILVSSMENALTLPVPFLVEAKTGNNWEEAH